MKKLLVLSLVASLGVLNIFCGTGLTTQEKLDYEKGISNAANKNALGTLITKISNDPKAALGDFTWFNYKVKDLAKKKYVSLGGSEDDWYTAMGYKIPKKPTGTIEQKIKEVKDAAKAVTDEIKKKGTDAEGLGIREAIGDSLAYLDAVANNVAAFK